MLGKIGCILGQCALLVLALCLTICEIVSRWIHLGVTGLVPADVDVKRGV